MQLRSHWLRYVVFFLILLSFISWLKITFYSSNSHRIQLPFFLLLLNMTRMFLVHCLTISILNPY